jgi:HlyD family secretion protein
MQKKHFPKPVIPVIILALAVGTYFLVTSLGNKETPQLSASGTIEAVSISISPEIGGKVTEVQVDEGGTVKAGDTLFRLDDALLQAQRSILASSLELARSAAATADSASATAQANYDLILASANLESAAVRAAEWRVPNPAGYTLPGGSFTTSDLIISAQKEVDAAAEAQGKAETALNTLLLAPANAEFVRLETDLLNKRFAAQTAQDVLNRALLSGNSDLIDSAQTAYDNTRTALDDAQSAYDKLKDSDSAKAILTARIDLVLAQERTQSAKDRQSALQIGENSLKVKAAQATLDQAKAAASQAHQTIVQAEANLALIDVQLTKLTVVAPTSGVILTRSIQPGEVIAAGASALSLAQLDKLTITVFIPEDQYGALSIGQTARLNVDSFPGVNFTATIVSISDQAQFTPRNVQTTEGRKTTVFAVKLQVENPENKLKPGMPADVLFE